MPLVSVILPVYNAAPYVDAAIRSILTQTLTDFELIIVDDKSTDNSLQIVRSHSDPRIEVIQQDSNQGYPHAMSRALRVARGRYVARMDADDISEPTRLEHQVYFLEVHDEFCFVSTRRYWLTPYGRKIDPPHMHEHFVVETWDDLMDGNRHFTDAAVVVSRDLVEEVGGYRTYLRSGQDVDLWLRILELGRPMATLTEPLYGRRLHPAAITFSQGVTAKNQLPRILAEERRRLGIDRVMRGETVEPDRPLEEDMRKAQRWRTLALWNTMSKCVRAGDYRGAGQFLRVALLVTPWSWDTLGYNVKCGLKMGSLLLPRKSESILGSRESRS